MLENRWVESVGRVMTLLPAIATVMPVEYSMCVCEREREGGGGRERGRERESTFEVSNFTVVHLHY